MIEFINWLTWFFSMTITATGIGVFSIIIGFVVCYMNLCSSCWGCDGYRKWLYFAGAFLMAVGYVILKGFA